AWESLMSVWGIDVRCAASAEEAFAIIDDGFTPFGLLFEQGLRCGERGFVLLKGVFERIPDFKRAIFIGFYL
ncbi:hybrid sensor histidine kinase/response regulator, partial [Enterobacter hormaechei]